jgi:hypothetical protein
MIINLVTWRLLWTQMRQLIMVWFRCQEVSFLWTMIKNLLTSKPTVCLMTLLTLLVWWWIVHWNLRQLWVLIWLNSRTKRALLMRRGSILDWLLTMLCSRLLMDWKDWDYLWWVWRTTRTWLLLTFRDFSWIILDLLIWWYVGQEWETIKNWWNWFSLSCLIWG